jgi:hypothetical protein
MGVRVPASGCVIHPSADSAAVARPAQAINKLGQTSLNMPAVRTA